MNDWRIFPGRVLGELRQWATTTTLMQARIQADDAGDGTRRGDMYLFAIAARQVLRFAELALQVAPEETKGQIEAAIRAFEASAPDLKNIRDVVDHYNDYLLGAGRTYDAKTPDHWSENSLGSVFVPTQMWVTATEGVFELHILPAPGEHLVLNISREADAARTLASAIEAALGG